MVQGPPYRAATTAPITHDRLAGSSTGKLDCCTRRSMSGLVCHSAARNRSASRSACPSSTHVPISSTIRIFETMARRLIAAPQEVGSAVPTLRTARRLQEGREFRPGKVFHRVSTVSNFRSANRHRDIPLPRAVELTAVNPVVLFKRADHSRLSAKP